MKIYYKNCHKENVFKNVVCKMAPIFLSLNVLLTRVGAIWISINMCPWQISMGGSYSTCISCTIFHPVYLVIFYMNISSRAQTSRQHNHNSIYRPTPIFITATFYIASSLRLYPTGTRRSYNVIVTSKQRCDRFDVIMTLLLSRDRWVSDVLTVITVPADDLVPNGAKSSSGHVTH